MAHEQHRADCARVKEAEAVTGTGAPIKRHPAFEIAFDMEDPIREAGWLIKALMAMNSSPDRDDEAAEYLLTKLEAKVESLMEYWQALFDKTLH